MGKAHLLLRILPAAAVLFAVLPASAFTPTHTFGPSPTPTPTGTKPRPQAVITVTPNPARSGQRVVLNGSTGGGSGFQWTQTGGDVTVEIEDADQLNASFVVPPLESRAEITVKLEQPGVIPAEEVVTLFPSDTVHLEVENVIGAPGATVDFDVVMRTLGYEVTALDHALGFDSFAAVAVRDGQPDCLVGDDLSIESANAVFSPTGCTPGVDCTGIRMALRTTEPIPDGAVVYHCSIDIDDGESGPSCSHPLTCAGGLARTESGEELDLDCADGNVEAEYSIRSLQFELIADPENPVVGDSVHLSARAVGDGGLPSYQLRDAGPFLRVIQSPPPSSGPLGNFVEFEAIADCPGTAPLRVSVSYETRCGCPDHSFFCFTGMTSSPLPLAVRAREGFTVSGVVNEFPACFGAQRGYTVTIQPLGFTTQTDFSSGGFHFDVVPPGDYTLFVSPSCNPFGCWAPQPVRVVDSNVDVTICPVSRDATPTVASTTTVTPTASPTGTMTPTPSSTPIITPTSTATATPTNPPGSCCGESCGGLSFIECQANAGCSWGDPCLQCGDVPASVSFGELEVDPALPKVGDAVTLSFDVMALVYSFEGATLIGASPFLEEVSHSETTFQMTATQAGKASVRLEVAYRTERACTDSFGNTYYSPGPVQTVTSAPYEIEIAEASTPTATATETRIPTATGGGNDSDGCQLEAGGSGILGTLPWWLALVLVVRVRRLAR